MDWYPALCVKDGGLKESKLNIPPNAGDAADFGGCERWSPSTSGSRAYARHFDGFEVLEFVDNLVLDTGLALLGCLKASALCGIPWDGNFEMHWVRWQLFVRNTGTSFSRLNTLTAPVLSFPQVC